MIIRTEPRRRAIGEQVRTRSAAVPHREKPWCSILFVAVSGKVGLLCVRVHDNKTKKERVKRTFLSHSHSAPPPHPHCYSLPPHPQFPSCAFFRVYWMFFPHPATKPAFLCHNLTAWCSAAQLRTGMVKRERLIEARAFPTPLPPSVGSSSSLKSRNSLVYLFPVIIKHMLALNMNLIL